MQKNLLMLYFDGFPAHRLKLYGGLIDNPNIDALVARSLFYSNVISTSASTAMSLTSMFTGLFPHEFGRRSYTNIDSGLPTGTVSLFVELEEARYNTFVLWDPHLETANPAKHRINVWSGANTKFLHFKRFSNKYAKAILDKRILKRSGKIWLLDQMLAYIKKLPEPWAMMVRFGFELSDEFIGRSKNITDYKWDDELIEDDYVIGLLMAQFPENTRMLLSADHGRMYGEQGMWGYAFNLCEGTLRVPIIDYNLHDNGGTVNSELVGLVNYRNIVLNKPWRRTKYLYADTAYADQWHRKTMVRKGRWKYIYHRDGWPCREQLFDLQADPHELIDLARPVYTDPYRDTRPKGDTVDPEYSPSALNVDGKLLCEVLPRHDWPRILKVLDELRNERKRIWALQGVYE